MTNINDFDPSLLNIDEVSFRGDELIMYDIKYIKNLNRVNTLYLVFNNLDECFKKVVETNICFLLQQKKNRIMLDNYTKLFDEIKEQIELITGDKMFTYDKEIVKIKFRTSDDLPYNKMINISVCVVIVSGVFEENDN